tara:strand:- start:71 stop:601 length:531 start_codon:yes stop_codon:yes gene_type:complete
MNFFYDLFKSNNIQEDDKEDDSLINNNLDNINNICVTINSNSSNDVKKNREYDTEFINYNKITKHNFKLYIYENLNMHNIIKSTNYFNKTPNNYYIEFIKDVELFTNKGKISIFIKDEFEKNICIVDFNYVIHNDFEYNNDIIKIKLKNSYLNMYLKKNKSNKFYFYKFIYNKYSC